MFTVYILRNKENKHYIAYTSKSPETRLAEHNSGKNRWTCHKGPWELVHTEQFELKTEAFRREKKMEATKVELLLKSL